MTRCDVRVVERPAAEPPGMVCENECGRWLGPLCLDFAFGSASVFLCSSCAAGLGGRMINATQRIDGLMTGATNADSGNI